MSENPLLGVAKPGGIYSTYQARHLAYTTNSLSLVRFFRNVVNRTVYLSAHFNFMIHTFQILKTCCSNSESFTPFLIDLSNSVPSSGWWRHKAVVGAKLSCGRLQFRTLSVFRWRSATHVSSVSKLFQQCRMVHRRTC